jgi:hypothetical protein
LIWRRVFNLWHILLVAANCLLLIAIIHVWLGGGETSVASRTDKGPKVPQTPILRDQQPLSVFRVVAAKNLFSPDRSGPEQGAPVAKAQNTLEGRELLGIIIIGNERVALVSGKRKERGRQASEVEVMRLGEEWEGLKVVEISNEAVTFQSKEGKKTLNFPE